MQIIAKFAEAMVAWRAGNFAVCLNLTIEGLRLAQESGVHLWDCHLLCHGIASALSMNDQNRAEAMLRHMEAGLPRMRRIGRLYYHHLACWMSLQKGDLSSSYDHAKLAAGLSFELKVPYLEAISRACLAEVYLQCASYEQADHEITEARRIGLGMKSRQIEFMCLIFYAAQQLQQGLHPNSLCKALALGREHRIFTMFGWRLPIIAQLCSIALDSETEIPMFKNSFESGNYHRPLRRFLLSGPGRSKSLRSADFPSSSMIDRSSLPERAKTARAPQSPRRIRRKCQ